MENTLLSITELRDVLSTPAYTYTEPEHEYIKVFENLNVWTSEETFRLFDKLIEEAGGKPPVPSDYIDQATALTKRYWFKDSPAKGRIASWKMVNGTWQATYLTWGPQMEKAIRWRLSRMYQSYIVEYSVSCTLHSLYPSFTMIASYELDLVAGVDIAVVNKADNKIIYIHVTKNSQWALSSIDKKGKKKAYFKDSKGNKHYWQRNYSHSHTVFAYDKQTSESTEELNGHYLFKETYIAAKTQEKMAEPDLDIVTGGTSELLEFHKYLTESKIRPDGINAMLIHFKKDKGENA